MVLVIGECLVDLLADPAQPEHFVAKPGGGPANTAVALARLGEDVRLLTRYGADPFGVIVRSHLADNGVDLSPSTLTSEPTTLAVASVDAGGNARYTFYLSSTACGTWSLAPLGAPGAPPLAVIHTGSLFLADDAARAELRGVLDEHPDAVLSLDPNVRIDAVGDVAAYRGDLEALVAQADIVRASEDDLLALYPDQDPAAAARAWNAGGAGLVVLSRGARPPLALWRGEPITGPSVATAVVDTVAAGDTFSAALLAWLGRAALLRPGLAGLDRPAIEACLAFAVTAASITCERAGADPPTLAEVEARTVATARSGA